MIIPFPNRVEAGRQLAQKLMAYADCPDVLVLALPRGGVPVASEVAKALNAPLDVCLVRKLGVPGQEELAMGAIGMGGVRVLNRDVLEWRNISQEVLEQVTAQEEQELQRRNRLYRGDRPMPTIKDRCVILVDDGIATGSTMRAAIATLKPQQPEFIVVATPVAPPSVCQALKAEVNEVVVLYTPESFSAIGTWYRDFTQTSDAEVRRLLEHAAYSASGMF
ncbi:MAG TPA: phosphoribosyltransferase [Synechococcales cyanobacterium M55_K2018_004]|nr:phosphoribosyltransferase [Synechococcales cyanobacterium M55_K2018_004]